MRIPQRSLTKRSIEEPDELTCSICFTIFRDPVVTSRGFTYERKALIEYWKSPVCNGQAKDPRSGNLVVERRLVPNWDIRRAVERFLMQNPGYIPHGWPDRSIPAPERDEIEATEAVLPGGFKVGDVVATVHDQVWQEWDSFTRLPKYEAGKVTGPSLVHPDTTLRCEFLELGEVEVIHTMITRRNLPGAYQVGNHVVSLIDHSCARTGESLKKGEAGIVAGEATVDPEWRLRVDFANMKSLDIHPEQICPVELPGCFRYGDRVASVIIHQCEQGNLNVGDVGTVVGRATVDQNFRIKVDFPNLKGLDMFPNQVARHREPLLVEV